jgi:hypothetical protein
VRRGIAICTIGLALCFSPVRAATAHTDTVSFLCNELLCRPTATSVSIHASASTAIDVYCEYGFDSLAYPYSTEVTRTLDSIPFLITLQNLQPNTQYYYRLRYREPGTAEYTARRCGMFHTQRPRGTSFTFAIQADPHLDTNSNPAVYAVTLQNILSRHPDFLLDLGDTFMSEKQPVITPATILDRHLLLRSYFDIACHSVPLYLVQGNHDGELGWRRDSTANNLPVWQTNTRKQYYPNPVPDGFYSGDSISEPFVGLRENYYAWEWGNALFVVIDPYWYTPTKPGWNWTLGENQYRWFKNVLESSAAKFKFVFCHQLVGGNGNDARGGAEFAQYFESGGRNLDSTWGFATYRPGWEKPIHTLMVENHVSAYFHGHDHFFGYQQKDGVVYQEVPQPSLRSFTSIQATQYGYVNGVFIPNRGYLAVTVTDTGATVEYVRSYLSTEETGTRHNRDVSYTYRIDTANVNVANVTIPLVSGWNLLSNPVSPASDSVTALFPTSLYPYGFGYSSSGYSQTYRLPARNGYWLKCGAATLQTISGGSRLNDSIPVSAGWNLVGSLSQSIDTSSVVSVPPGILASPWFEYESGYTMPARITAGKGYWVRARSAGNLILSAPAVEQHFRSTNNVDHPLTGLHSLTITDALGHAQTLYFGAAGVHAFDPSYYTMPPLPPAGAFDARFVAPDGGSIAKFFDEKASGDVDSPIALQVEHAPLSVEWNIAGDAGSYALTAMNDGSVISEREMKANGRVIFTAAPQHLSLRYRSTTEVPREFGLSQNYPNPFNPVTNIRFTLPARAHVMLRIFNILGQEVETLLDEDRAAGVGTVEWNGSRCASGVYYYRMQAGGFVATKQLLLIK